MKKLYNLRMLILALVVIGSLSCKKSVDGTVQDESLNRSFTPASFSVSTAKDTAKFKWNAELYAVKGNKWTLELSTDTLFSKIDLSKEVDTLGVNVLEPAIKLNTPYFARIRANGGNGKGPSNYAYLARSFRLSGQNFFKVLRDFEVTSNSVLLHWFKNSLTAGLTSIVLTPATGGSPITMPISSGEAAAGEKPLNGLSPETRYTAQLLAGNKSLGFLTFSTLENVNYTTVISQSDNLANAITAAADGAIIGLNPGTYSLPNITYITQKSITLRSVSNSPTDTKILSREIDLVGDSAGVRLAGIEFNGNYTGTTYGVAFMQLLGTQAVSSTVATFRNVRIENCIIHDYTRCLLRANYGTAANDHKINNISIQGSQIYNIDQANVQGYYILSLEKLQLRTLSINRSTLFNLGEGLINMGTNLSTATNITPAITIAQSTINNIGGNNKYLLIDANANKIVLNIQNNIIANTPISQTVQGTAFRASATGNTLLFVNNNTFKMSSSVGGPGLSLAGLSQANNLNIDLGWTVSTTTFSLAGLDQTSKVQTGSTSGSTLGDPRWAY